MTVRSLPRVEAARPANVGQRRIKNLRQPGRSWFEVRNHADDDTELYIYDEIGMWGVYAEELIAELQRIDAPRFTLRINSPGGDVFEGIAIYNAVLDHPAECHVIVDSWAASAASFVAQAGDTVTMNRGAQAMIHDAWGLCIGNAADMEGMREVLDRLSNEIAGIYAARGGGEVEAWRERMRAESWFNGQEAVEVGLADKVVETPPRRGADGDNDAEGDASAGGSGEDRLTDLSGFGYKYASRDAAPAPVGLEGADGSGTPADTAVGPHETATKEGTWDAGKEQGRLPSPMPVATARKMYALYDGDRVEEGKIVKAACSLPHHFVSEDGTPGAASINGVNNALARLDQTKGYSDAEKATARRHLEGHQPKTEDHADPAVAPVAGEQQPDPPAEPVGEPGPDADPITEPAADDPVDQWASITQHLTTPATSDDVFATLKGALL